MKRARVLSMTKRSRHRYGIRRRTRKLVEKCEEGIPNIALAVAVVVTLTICFGMLK